MARGRSIHVDGVTSDNTLLPDPSGVVDRGSTGGLVNPCSWTTSGPPR